jgi:uncharacterized protein YfiM (DUF2279 family)
MIARLALAVTLGHPGDAWFGPDKMKHFFVAAFTQSVSYSLLQAAGVKHDRALAGAWAVTATVSVAKEVYDRRSYGLFSVRDLAWDAAGAGVATLIIRRSVRSEADMQRSAGSSARVLRRVRPLLSVAARSPILAPEQPPIPAPRP